MSVLARLTPRERLYLGVGLVSLLFIAVIQFFYLPLKDAKATYTQGIASQEKVLRELLVQVAAYEKLKARTEEFRRRLASRPRDFSIFSYVEKQATESGVKGNIRSMTVGRGTTAGYYEEIPLDVRLERLTLKQLTQFLALIESADSFLQVKKLTISRMKDAPGYLAVTLQVVTYRERPGTPSSRGGGAR